MASISLYTTYDDVRAILGVSDKELEDAALGQRVYADSLELDLIEIGATLPEFITQTEAIHLASRSFEQRQFLRLVEQFATYSVARKAGSALAMSPKTVSDGKASFSRFADSPYKQTLELIDREYYRLRAMLAAAFGALIGAADAPSGPPRYMVGARAAIDRVTGS